MQLMIILADWINWHILQIFIYPLKPVFYTLLKIKDVNKLTIQ